MTDNIIDSGIPTEDDRLKKCCVCDTMKTLKEFHRDRTKADGRENRCGKCKNQKDTDRKARKRRGQEPLPTLSSISSETWAYLAAVQRLIDTYPVYFNKLHYSERVRLGVQEQIVYSNYSGLSFLAKTA